MFRWFVLWEFFVIFIYIISLVYFLRRWEIVGVNLFIKFGYWILFIYVLIEVELEMYLFKIIKNIVNNSMGRNYLLKLV